MSALRDALARWAFVGATTESAVHVVLDARGRVLRIAAALRELPAGVALYYIPCAPDLVADVIAHLSAELRPIEDAGGAREPRAALERLLAARISVRLDHRETAARALGLVLAVAVPKAAKPTPAAEARGPR